MKAFDPNHKLLDEMYQDDYYPAFLVDKVKGELQKVIDLLESGETDSLMRTTARSKRQPGNVLRQLWPTFWNGSTSPLTPRRPSGNGTGDSHGRKRTGHL